MAIKCTRCGKTVQDSYPGERDSICIECLLLDIETRSLSKAPATRPARPVPARVQVLAGGVP